MLTAEIAPRVGATICTTVASGRSLFREIAFRSRMNGVMGDAGDNTLAG